MIFRKKLFHRLAEGEMTDRTACFFQLIRQIDLAQIAAYDSVIISELIHGTAPEKMI